VKSPISALPDLEHYFDEGSGAYYGRKPDGHFGILPGKDLDTRLIKAGFSAKKGRDGLSEVDEARLRIQDDRCVQLAMPLAGYLSGVITSGGIKILVTSSPCILSPVAGEFQNIQALLRGLLDEPEHMQQEVLYAWLKRAYESLRSGRFTPGQAVFFAGPQNCGKTLLTLLITTILGGRSARAYGFLSGKTEFNKDVFSAEHQIIDDEIATSDHRSRRALGAAIKALTVSVTHRLHAKNRDAITVEPFFRLTGCLNDNAEDLNVLPPLDDSVADKLIILRAHLHEFSMPTETEEQQATFRRQLQAEVPAFLHFLCNWEVPAEIRNSRFGVVSFRHPALVDALTELQPEERVQRIIDHVIFGRNLRALVDPRPATIIQPALPQAWSGSAEQLEAVLRNDETYGAEVVRLFGSVENRCGIYLGRLAERSNSRVSSRIVRGQKLWTIQPPVGPEQPMQPPPPGNQELPTT
jgi:hypothetical protein